MTSHYKRPPATCTRPTCGAKRCTAGTMWTLLVWLGATLVTATSVTSYRVHQMRICIQSVDPSRLSSQCVYCKTRLFPLTVRLCTSNTYLPARMTLNEAFCLATSCRRQLPRMPPEPYPSGGSVPIGGNTNPAVLANPEEGASFNTNINANGEPNHDDPPEAFEEAESLAQAPTKVRPPAKFYLGKPHKGNSSLRPSLFG